VGLFDAPPKLLARNTRMVLQVKNIGRMSEEQKQAMLRRADAICRGQVSTGM
jgi:hypothetical protein